MICVRRAFCCGAVAGESECWVCLFFRDVLSLRATVREGPTSCYQARARCAGWTWKSLKDALKQLPNVFAAQLNARLRVKCTSGSSSLSVCFSLNWPMPASLLLSTFYRLKNIVRAQPCWWPLAGFRKTEPLRVSVPLRRQKKKYQTEDVLSLWTAEVATIAEHVRMSAWTYTWISSDIC